MTIYFDLNPVAAGIAATPESSKHTSVRQRVEHAKASGKLDAVKAAAKGSVAGLRASGRFVAALYQALFLILVHSANFGLIPSAYAHDPMPDNPNGPWITTNDLGTRLVLRHPHPMLEVNGKTYKCTRLEVIPAPFHQRTQVITAMSLWAWLVEWYVFMVDVTLTDGNEADGVEVISPGYGQTLFPRNIHIVHTSCVALNKAFHYQIGGVIPSHRDPVLNDLVVLRVYRNYYGDLRWRYSEVTAVEIGGEIGIALGVEGAVGVSSQATQVTPRVLELQAHPLGRTFYSTIKLRLDELVSDTSSPGGQ